VDGQHDEELVPVYTRQTPGNAGLSGYTTRKTASNWNLQLRPDQG
jgi:hypothetical protein